MAGWENSRLAQIGARGGLSAVQELWAAGIMAGSRKEAGRKLQSGLSQIESARAQGERAFNWPAPGHGA